MKEGMTDGTCNKKWRENKFIQKTLVGKPGKSFFENPDGQKMILQDRQCTYQGNNEACSCNHCCSGKVTSITKLSVYVCCFSHPARNAHALWPAWLYHIFPNYLTNGTIFGRKLLNLKYVF
jgi:hypothetical protein